MLINGSAIDEVPINGDIGAAANTVRHKLATPPYRVNPLTGMNSRGFIVGPYNPIIEKQVCLALIEHALPVDCAVESFRYKTWGFPGDSVVELKILTPVGTDTHEVRVPIDRNQTPWGGPIPKAIADFVRAMYP